jgi:hypothetical protein
VSRDQHGHDPLIDTRPVDSYPSRHWSLSNPEGPSSNNLPLLLRRVADAIEADDINMDSVLDLQVSGDEVTEHGSWWRATLYWSEGAE